MGKKKTYSRNDVIAELLQLALGPVNDAVKLGFINAPTEAELEGLNLKGLTEFKRNANGTMELKFIDRQKALECLLAQMDASENEKAEAFLRALGNSGPEE